MNRRQILVSGSMMALLPLVGGLTSPLRADATQPREGERVLGDPEASVTIVEYSSLTCPHCARFHSDIMPQVRQEWIETGRAKLVYRHFPLDSLALRAAMVADAMSSDRAFFAFIEVLFETQAQWSRAQDPLGALAQQAQLAGMGRQRFDAAVDDEAAMNAILERLAEARETFQVDSTPTFIVEGRKVVGVSGYEQFAEALEAAES